MIRQLASAGRFFPANPQHLRQDIEQMLVGLKVEPSEHPPRALIVPHASLRYSGRCAMAALIHLRGHAQTIERLVIVGPAHRTKLHRPGLSSASGWNFPQGQVPLAHEANDTLVTDCEAEYRDDAHDLEHTLEVPLVLVVGIGATAPIVPVLLGAAPRASTADWMDSLTEDSGTVLIASADLSHYHGLDDTEELDRRTAMAIEAGDADGITDSGTCARTVLQGIVEWTNRQGLHFERCMLTNSADFDRNTSNVVGYGSWVAH